MITNYPKGSERYFVVHNREEAVKELKKLYDRGYRWIARDMDCHYLSIFSIRPNKYENQFWGYANPCAPKAMMCELVKNTDITEINWKNRQPTELWKFIKDNDVND